MELRHLRYFVAVAEELHFRRAAERLHIAQPPLSLQIAQLEAEMGVRLFERSPGRPVRLTPAGAVFLEETRAILSGLEQSVERARRARAGEVGCFTIGLTSAMAFGVVPQLVQNFRRHNPGISIRLLELTTAQQEKALLSRGLDLGFCYPLLEHRDFHTLSVHEEGMVLAIPVTHPLAKERRIPLRLLRQEAFLSFPRSVSPGLYDLILSACQRAKISPRIEQEATQLQTIVALVCAGVGVAIVPESMAALNRTGVAYRPFLDRMPTIHTLAVWRKEEVYPGLQRLVDSLRHRGELAHTNTRRPRR
jgi:DNA-binding transcriptional LysR family regulator